jgi:hypothetical protein
MCIPEKFWLPVERVLHGMDGESTFRHSPDLSTEGCCRRSRLPGERAPGTVGPGYGVQTRHPPASPSPPRRLPPPDRRDRRCCPTRRHQRRQPVRPPGVGGLLPPLRGQAVFAGVDELAEQIRADIDQTRRMLSSPLGWYSPEPAGSHARPPDRVPTRPGLRGRRGWMSSGSPHAGRLDRRRGGTGGVGPGRPLRRDGVTA